MTAAAVASMSRGARSLAEIALAGAAALWFCAALLAPWAFVHQFANAQGPIGFGTHFRTMLTALEGLGDFGAFLAGWLQLLAGG
jgi:hypothetical protein